MDPGTTIVALTSIVSLFVIMPAIIARGFRARRADTRASTGGEMRASELRRMISDAVEMETAALAARVTDLEERLGDEPVHAIRERVGARVGGPALTAAFDPEADLDDADGRPVQRRARA